MKDTKVNGIRIFQIVVVVVALLNLLALFVFDYEIPAFFKGSSTDATHTEGDTGGDDVAGTETPAAYSFQFESDAFTYDGNGEFNLLAGVSVVDAQGNAVEQEIFAHIVTGDTLSDKEITYTADTDAGQITATRMLTLSNYSGPSITLPETLPDITEELVGNILNYMPTDGTFVAKDGFGHDITSAVSADYTIDPNDPTVVHYIFSVTNMFNDAVSEAADLTIDSTRPILVLTQGEATIPKGTSFQPLLYLEKAVDQQGNDLSHRVHISGNVDVNTPGTYTLTYTTTTEAGESSLPQTLVVTVE